RGYRFLVWGLAVADTRPMTVGRSATVMQPRTARRARLAVLPFVSFAADSRQDVFSEGLTDEVLTQVARSCPAHVGVIARTSAMRAVTGAALGADYFLEGSVRREGERVRIVAQLIDAQEETHVWAATYDRVGADMLTIQTEIAAQMAAAVAEALSALRPLL